MLRVSLCQRNKARKILTWYARIFDTETKDIRYESLGTTKKTEAHDLMLSKQAAGEFSKKQKCITLGSAFSMYLDDLSHRGCSDATIDCARESLNGLSSLFTLPLDKVTKKMVIETFNEKNERLAPSTYNTHKTYVKTAFRFAVNVLEAIPSSPADALKAKKALKQERDFWTQEQIDRILDCAPSADYRVLWSFMAFAGLRIHEALKMRSEDIRDGMIYVIGKGRKPAKVPVSSRLKTELDRVGWQWNFSRMNRRSNWLIKAARQALGDTFKGTANNHRFRHSFASALIKNGTNIKSVQKLLRHSNIQTTLQIYSHVLDEDLSTDIEKMFGDTK